MYSLLHPSPVKVIFTDFGCSSLAWSPQRPLLFAASGRNNAVLFYELSSVS